MENSTLGNHAFIEKTKKQAKRLFKLAQSKDSTLKITNLASAQEILAQINGYPHWHALETTINKQPALNIFETPQLYSQDTQEITNVIDGVNYFLQDDKLVSVFEVVNLPYGDIKSFTIGIERLKKKCSLQFNMGFHEVHLFISNRKRESSSNNYDFSSLSNSLGLAESLVKKLFTFNISIEKQSTFILSALIVIKTEEQMALEHAEFCSNFKKEHDDWLDNFKLRIFLTNEEKALLNHEDKKLKQRVSINEKYELSLERIIDSSKVEKGNFMYFDLLNNAWIHSIGLLSRKNFEWDIEVNLNQNNFIFYQLQENKSNEVYLAGLYKSLNTNNDILEPKMFEFESKQENNLPWKTGIPFINHNDNEVSYYEPGSSLQNSHQTLIYAPPGAGKSLLMSVLNLFSLGDNLSNLPYISTIDMGPSSKPLISFLKEILPSEKKHLVAYHRIRMTKEYAVNVFDTPLGCRFPNNEQFHFLSNFLTLIITDSNQQKPEPLTTSFIQAVIEDMYYQVSDKVRPKKYDKGINTHVDQCLLNTNMKITEQTSWWEVVDYLFEKGHTHEAMLSQRYAVPVLSDAVASIQNDKIKEHSSRIMVGSNETLSKYFTRRVNEAISEYDIISQPTIFGIGNSRVVSLDLEEVFRTSRKEAQKQTALMYMIARHLIMPRHQQKIETVVAIPYPIHMNTPEKIPAKKYKDYHKAQISSTSHLRKIVCFDDFHIVSNNELVQNQITVDMREARKWGLEITIATQSLRSLTEVMKSFITSLFIMGPVNPRELQEVCETFYIDNPKDKKMLSQTHGPKNGKLGVMFAKFSTNQGVFSKLLSFQPTPHLLTMLNTSVEDAQVRENLLTKFNMEKTVDILTKEYPKGIKAELEKEFGYPYPENFVDLIFKKLVKKYD